VKPVFTIDPSLANDNICQSNVDNRLLVFLIKSRVSFPYKYRHPNLGDIEFSCDHFSIAQGELNIPAGYQWLSCLEQLQVPLVFVGIWPIGVPDPRYKYGRPWTWEASLVFHALSRHRSCCGLTRSQIIDIYRDLLEAKKVPLRSVFVGCAKVRMLFH
jgi:hypothetical protein